MVLRLKREGWRYHVTVVGMEIKSFVQKYILNVCYVLVGVLYTGTGVVTYMIS